MSETKKHVFKNKIKITYTRPVALWRSNWRRGGLPPSRRAPPFSERRPRGAMVRRNVQSVQSAIQKLCGLRVQKQKSQKNHLTHGQWK